MEFRILGQLEVCADGRPVALPGAKPRALLAVLALHADQPVSAEHLALALWGEDAPAGAVKTVQVHVSRVRKALGDPDVLVTTPAGYRLRVHPGETDAQRFEREVAAGRQALAAGRPERAADVLRDALALWRGAPLGEFAWAPFARAETNRLEELHLAALELRVEADLIAGRHAELVAELRQLTGHHPWRERLHAQLMLALYRSGRQADALEAYRHAREVLIGQLGIEPGRELHDLHQAMLVHDPSLEAPLVAMMLTSDRRSALPAPPNRTVGRQREVAAVGERLRSGSVRVLTLTGPGGVGKTRLALEAARLVEADFADGAHFVSLAALRRPQDVPAAIVTSLGIVKLSGESADQAVQRFLAAKHLLLVMDNCEHLLSAAPFIGQLARACPAVTVLATSREPLAVHAEQRHPVTPLAGADAVALFCERARAHDPGFELGDGNAAAVAEICRRVDALPLAIELTAARCGLLSPGEIAERLDAALVTRGAGARDAPARQQTLRATIDWSHDLLDDAEKACFARFAVFAGGATVHAAETITGADLGTLDRLVAKSLLVRRQPPQAATRLGMLETIRAYAAQRLAASEEERAIRESHYRDYLALARHHGDERALWGADGKEHLSHLDADSENLHAALQWAIDRSDAERALAMVAALGRHWLMRDRYADAVQWIDRALSLPGSDARPELRVHALCVKGLALWPLGRGGEGPAVLAEAEAAARELGDPVLVSRALEARAQREATRGRLDLAEALADEALESATAAADDWALALAAFAKAMVAPSIAELHERVDRAASLLDRVGNVYHHADLLSSAAYSAMCMDSDRDAKRLVERAIPLVRRLANPYQWMMLRGNFGLAALLTGDTTAAREAFHEELELCRELVVLPFAAEGLRGLAAVAAAHGDAPRAARLLGAAAPYRYGEPEDPVEARLNAVVFEPARRRHGARAWDAAVHEGSSLSFDDAIADALEEPGARRPSGARNWPEAAYRGR